jgi:hypothetical protein
MLQSIGTIDPVVDITTISCASGELPVIVIHGMRIRPCTTAAGKRRRGRRWRRRRRRRRRSRR